MHNFRIGELYSRQHDIHDILGGNRQSGISNSTTSPFIFLFAGPSGKKFGYELDYWDENGVFTYTGEGQVGDMKFTAGNKALRDHVKNGQDLLLFQYEKKGGPYRYRGQFVCIGYEFKEALDRNKEERHAIVFQLKSVDSLSGEDNEQNNRKESLELSDLRKQAYAAVEDVKQTKSSVSSRTFYERNAKIKEYILVRANGICECCGKPAPFMKKDGTPYLEPHHIYKISDKGMDHPILIAALTPNCHREIHHGKNGNEIDCKLEKLIFDKEHQSIKG